MRKQFCDALVARASNPKTVFLTGDLGFMALEPLQKAFGHRFINAGIAEQNMLSVAGAMSKTGLDTWAYSIAPFCYARPFEQIRNDIALHGLPVRIVGNGGGYGYGVMGPTHHAIEDYGVMLTLSGMSACIPVFDEDVAAALDIVDSLKGPCYVRLGRGEPPKGYSPEPFAAWRQLTQGDGPIVIAVGPLASTYIDACAQLPQQHRPNLWAVGMLPIEKHPPPSSLLEQINQHDTLIVAEEHVQHGGFGGSLLLWLAKTGAMPNRFKHHHALAHRYDRYGSQAFLRKQSQLDPESLLKSLSDL